MDRYFRWRKAIKMPIWVLDQHWYELFGWLYRRQNSSYSHKLR